MNRSRAPMTRQEPEYRSFETVAELGVVAAERIVDGIRAAADRGRRYLLGCPGGRTPKPIYDALGAVCARDHVDCSHVVIVMMDDYVELVDGGFRAIDATAAHSCRRFAEHDIRRVVNAGLTPDTAIAATSVWFPDPASPERFDERLADAGGVDLFLTASGASDGHVAFCGPGADVDGTSSVVELAPSTRHDNMSTFPTLTSLDSVPTHGVTVGLGTIRHHSREVLMVLHGTDKQESLRRIASAGKHDPDWPATFVHACDSAEVWYDAQAASSPPSPPPPERSPS